MAQTGSKLKKQVNLTEEDGGKGQGQSSKTKIGIVIILIIFISILHYATGYQAVYYHALYRDLYFIPLILSGLWFGLRGAIVASLSVTFIYLPYAIASWHVSSVSDFERVLSVILFNIIAAILGLTSDRERAMEIAIRKSEHLSAIGQAVSGVAHDIKTPLVAIGGFIRLARKALKGNDPVRDKLNIAIGIGRPAFYRA
ncbi:MAG: integral rane sensor signal transduction histidine kinase [Deltaproteobacteria bacterium]|nr:integral rane sensor signal transduction histidine kinase [Deltaproteobacteria bacterium]